MKKIFVKGFTGLLVCMALIIGCDSLNNSETEAGTQSDKTALKTAIDSANSAKNDVVVSVDGTDVYTTVSWVTADQLAAFTTAISAARAVYDTTGSDKTAVDTAKAALESATTAFVGQKQPGTKPDPVYDIFVVGASYLNGTNYYWKNGTKNTVSGFTGLDFMISDTCVDGDDVYYAGSYLTDENGNSQACYWKNGVKTDLSLPSTAYTNNRSNAVGIVITEGNLFIVGRYTDSVTGNSPICYWKNGIRTDLVTTDAINGYINDFSIFGNDVYISGGHYKMVEGVFEDTGCYWKNASRIDLVQGYPHIIEKTGADLYMAGSVGTSACYWKMMCYTAFPADRTPGPCWLGNTGNFSPRQGLF